MASDEEVEEVVDEFVDGLDPNAVESEAERLGITVDDLLTRIVNETKVRIDPR